MHSAEFGEAMAMSAIAREEAERAIRNCFKWISVKDRLPSAGVPVLVYRFPSIEIAVIYKKTDNETYWWLRNVGVIELERYTHWMPMPEPPKEGT